MKSGLKLVSLLTSFYMKKMLMTDTKTKCFVDCEELRENTAKFNFEDNTLKLGKANLSNQQLKRISLMFATDLKNFAETFGNSQNLTAKEIYSHLQNNQ